MNTLFIKWKQNVSQTSKFWDWPLGKNKNYILLNMILFNIMVFASTLNFVKLLIYLYSQVNVLQSVNVLEGNKQNISLLSNVHF